MRKITIFLVLIFFLIIAINTVNAGPSTGSHGTNAVTLDNPLGKDANALNPNIIIGKVIQMVLGVVGSLALLMFIYGGFTWMLAAGNNEKVQKGKEILIWATIGLVVIFSSYALIKMIFEGLGI